jgi:hypothetical protein
MTKPPRGADPLAEVDRIYTAVQGVMVQMNPTIPGGVIGVLHYLLMTLTQLQLTRPQQATLLREHAVECLEKLPTLTPDQMRRLVGDDTTVH